MRVSKRLGTVRRQDLCLLPISEFGRRAPGHWALGVVMFTGFKPSLEFSKSG